MPNEEKNSSVTISKNNSGFPEYLDFEKLRSEGIAYLGKLSGQLWTDHNVHDPGITIFEELCYAILDLGYRSNLPVEDILARNPADTSKDDNFLTPAEILTNNPLTINDYRKLLMDIPGVRNAWLEPAVDIRNICHQPQEDIVVNVNELAAINMDMAAPVAIFDPATTVECDEFLNGLYHVYIETEKDPDKDFYDDDPKKEKEAKDKYTRDIINAVRKTLMAHRNICEDFEDIYILCKLEMGVCATIELEDGSDPENVYVAIANKLNEFFSPAPRFYTLPQLLEKGKSIEDIFAGRPYSSASHGFVDTEELEKINLRKEIHTSDVFNALFEVDGVRKIAKLKLRNCGKDCTPKEEQKNSYWRNHLPENHVPVFSMACSGFEFTRNGMPVQIDTEKFATQLELVRLHAGKVLYRMPSLYLDGEVPKGIYHKGLDEYYSIQNDFPAVYGIGEGDLPEGASDKRKAWALQLKGYLFFFDQMLANYLSQLKNIRELFSFAHKPDKNKRHTYFLNTITTVPEINKLRRFNGDNELGVNGTLLVYPVEKKEWEKVKTEEKLAEEILESQKPFHFASLFELYEATDLLRNDLVHDGESVIKVYQTADECWLYIIESSTSDFILLSKKAFATESNALQHAGSVQYTGVFEDNYRSYLTADNRFTFNIELNIDSYSEYLGLLVENDELYHKRRKDFLTHLLSRFAEQFTDFVLLNWKPGQEKKDIETVERFLTNYADISRNRGRGWDYLMGGWKNDNESGFEKKVKALAGVNEWQKNHLCHFSVDPYDELYKLKFPEGPAAFEVNEKFDLIDEAHDAAGRLIKAMGDIKNYAPSYIQATRQYQLLLHYGAEQPAVHPIIFRTSHDADKLAEFLSQSISHKPAPDAVYEHSWIWKAELKNNKGKAIKASNETWSDIDAAGEGLKTLAASINNDTIWAPNSEAVKLELIPVMTGGNRFIDIEAFNIDINNTIIGKPKRFTYDVLDKLTNSFRLSPATDFGSAPEARDHCYKILSAAVTETNFDNPYNKDTNQYRVVLHINGKTEAIADTEYKTIPEAEEAIKHILATVNEYSYTLELKKEASSWKFRYHLGYKEHDIFLFNSKDIYSSDEKAKQAAAHFYENVGGLQEQDANNVLSLVHENDETVSLVVYAGKEGADIPAEAIHEKLEEQREIARMAVAASTNELEDYVTVDGPGRFGTFVYRLIDKNRVPAYYTGIFNNEGESWDRRMSVAAASKKAIRRIPQICLGGDIFPEVYDDEHNKRLRYQIKLKKAEWMKPGEKEIVLFESVLAFNTIEEADATFQSNYLHVLYHASDAAAYGKIIGVKPVPLPPKDACETHDMLAFIPPDTLKLLEERFGNAWKAELSKTIRLYPIKVIDFDSKEFALLFCKPFEEKPGSCTSKEKKWVYYFELTVPADTKHNLADAYWRSTQYFEKPVAAMQEFLYFGRLLKYTGNYFVDCGCTKKWVGSTRGTNSSGGFITTYSYKIFIREVLAQGINWYETADLAWIGIEEFICAVQSGIGFHNYLRSDDCCYSFYVTCGNGLLEHPCKYDSAWKRDKALEALHRHYLEFKKEKSYGQNFNAGEVILNNRHGNPFAKLVKHKAGTKKECDLYIWLAEAIATDEAIISYEDDGFLLYTFNEDEIVIKSTDQKISATEAEQQSWKSAWGKMLQNWSCYFPMIRSRVKTNSKQGLNRSPLYKYCVEIKLPGFNRCDEELNKPCAGCDDEIAIPTDRACYVAWKSPCCYATCEEAMEVYRKAIEYLSVKANYRPVFDCECNSFGISLHTYKPVFVPVTGVPRTSDVIAVNPQCYEIATELCKAVETSCSLVNSQGLHLIEHILLRPRDEKDCECRKKWSGCGYTCEFPAYMSEGGGACAEEDRNICFKPGSDPYSFIATAILPAWTYRFRDEANRNAFEGILYREVPAHVLLRILWLKPRDFCRLESAFKLWRRSMTGEKYCDTNFSICGFLDLLIGTKYDCLDDCFTCIPCTDPVEKPLNCVEKEKKERKVMVMKFQKTGVADFSRLETPHGFLNQVNEIYCFQKYCEAGRREQNDAVRGLNAGAMNEEERAIPEIEEEENITTPAEGVLPVEEEAGVDIDSLEETSVRNQPSEKKSKPQAEKKIQFQMKAQVINARLNRYKGIVTGVRKKSNENPLADKLESFLHTGGPDLVRLENLVAECIQNDKPAKKKAKVLNKEQQQDLIKAAVCFYLDKVCFNGKDESLINNLQPVIAQLSKIKMPGQVIYNYWNPDEVVRYEPETDVDFVRHVLSESK